MTIMTGFDELSQKKTALAVVGLGYVGLPLAVAFARDFRVIGFDISSARVNELRNGRDHTREADLDALKQSGIFFTDDGAALKEASFVVVAVPTPIDAHKNPDLGPIIGASTTVGRNLAPGSVVVFESTVYPGVTEEVCVPVLERESGLVCGRDFAVGYSPERINPGDQVHTLENIVKIVSGSDAKTADLLEKVYGSVVRAGIFKASSIKVAEAAKVIENTQRDINIALMNELAMIFDRLGLDTREVLEAAGTKWNFLKFTPGLVGGHCIGVDPYYLTYKAEELGYSPQVILAGRRINDGMGRFIAQSAVKKLIHTSARVKGGRVGILGITFKENVPDLRNTKVVDIIDEFREFGLEALVHDPHADRAETLSEYGLELCDLDDMRELDVLVLAVAHDEYRRLDPGFLRSLCRAEPSPVLVDVKGLVCGKKAGELGFVYWTL